MPLKKTIPFKWGVGVCSLWEYLYKELIYERDDMHTVSEIKVSATRAFHSDILRTLVMAEYEVCSL
jgi:hypothetical protein